MSSAVQSARARGLRVIRGPFVVAPPEGARVRTRLRASAEDEAVLRAVGRHLGSLASADLAARCAEGRLNSKGRTVSWRERKRALTAVSSSRWAGAVTRTSEDQWQTAERNLRTEKSSLQARVKRIESRLAVPAGQKQGHAQGYATTAERHGKQRRLQRLRHRLEHVERRLAAGQVSVCRGGRLAKARHNLEAAGLGGARWREQWESARLFLRLKRLPGRRRVGHFGLVVGDDAHQRDAGRHVALVGGHGLGPEGVPRHTRLEALEQQPLRVATAPDKPESRRTRVRRSVLFMAPSLRSRGITKVSSG
jgi:hypothetical protein